MKSLDANSHCGSGGSSGNNSGGGTHPWSAPLPDDCGPHPCPDGDLRRALHERLLALEFPAFTACVQMLLERMGYTEVTRAGRTRWRGRNQYGGGSGYDLTAVVRVGPHRRPVLVALKQFPPDRSVYQRQVDELRGACLRAGAAEGLLITTGLFAATVRRETVQNTPIVPVRLLDGEALLDLMIRHQIGIRKQYDKQNYTETLRESGQPEARKLHASGCPEFSDADCSWLLDESFFDALESTGEVAGETVTEAIGKPVRSHPRKRRRACQDSEAIAPINPVAPKRRLRQDEARFAVTIVLEPQHDDPESRPGARPHRPPYPPQRSQQ